MARPSTVKNIMETINFQSRKIFTNVSRLSCLADCLHKVFVRVKLESTSWAHWRGNKRGSFVQEEVYTPEFLTYWLFLFTLIKVYGQFLGVLLVNRFNLFMFFSCGESTFFSKSRSYERGYLIVDFFSCTCSSFLLTFQSLCNNLCKLSFRDFV